jgi:hypothetical protein
MATKITSCKVSVDFRNDTTAQIPVDGEVQGIASGTRTAVVGTSVYHVDTLTPLPVTPPEWVLASRHLALLVADGSIAIA